MFRLYWYSQQGQLTASLHENTIYSNGELIGDFSWRILSLRKAQRENTYKSIYQLMHTNAEQMYSSKNSFYYAPSRYLLMYLQQKGLLKKYYTAFRDNADDDPTGISQLEKVAGKKIDRIDKELLEFVNSFDKE
jgi:hypothetical protein